MVSADQIREVIAAYVRNNDAGVFVVEFSKLAFGINQHGDNDAIQLAKAVESKIALVQVGHFSQSSLREWLRSLLDRVVLAEPMISGNLFQSGSGSSINLQMAEQAVFPPVAVKPAERETAHA